MQTCVLCASVYSGLHESEAASVRQSTALDRGHHWVLNWTPCHEEVCRDIGSAECPRHCCFRNWKVFCASNPLLPGNYSELSFDWVCASLFRVSWFLRPAFAKHVSVMKMIGLESAVLSVTLTSRNSVFWAQGCWFVVVSHFTCSSPMGGPGCLNVPWSFSSLFLFLPHPPETF